MSNKVHWDTLVRLPQCFVMDYCDRGMPMPKIIRATKRNVWVALSDPNLPTLVDDARYYSDKAYQDSDYGAKALLRAVGL